MGFFSSSKTKDKWVKPPETTEQKIARSGLGQLATANLQTPVRPTAGLSDYEQGGMGILSKIMAGEAFADPSTSSYYAGLRQNIDLDTQAATDQLRHRQGLSGSFFSSPGQRAEADLLSRGNANKMSVLGQLYESERNRDNPYTRLQASMQYGQLPRQLEQQSMDSIYNADMNNLTLPYQLQAPILQTLLQDNPWMYQQGTTNPSMFSQLATPLGSLMGGLGLLTSGINFSGAAGYNPSAYTGYHMP